MEKIFLIIPIAAILGFLLFLTFTEPKTPTIFIDLEKCVPSYPSPLPANAYSNSSVLIPWSKDYQLSWNDFQGIPPEGHRMNACAHTWIHYTFLHNIIENSTHTEFYFSNVSVKAYFRVLDSWARDKVFEHDEKILRHEQGHFDIAEEHARKVQKIMEEELLGKTFAFNKTEVSKKQIIELQFPQEKINKIWNDQDGGEWYGLDLLYDAETGGGWNFEIQEQYNERFNTLRE